MRFPLESPVVPIDAASPRPDERSEPGRRRVDRDHGAALWDREMLVELQGVIQLGQSVGEMIRGASPRCGGPDFLRVGKRPSQNNSRQVRGLPACLGLPTCEIGKIGSASWKISARTWMCNRETRLNP